MSRSPDVGAASAEEPELVRYRNAWSALSQLIGKGRSFSGHERNCVYLNTGRDRTRAGASTRRFADVSAATGLDRPDDGRAVAVVDWDFDGDLDLWVANRTAPRVRFLRNDTESGHHWLALRLQGVTSNRDAIGARVEVIPRGVGEASAPRRYIKTLHAGDGYLSQSSKWIHFGLGAAGEIDRVIVAWPGGKRETFTGLAADRHYRVVEGSGKAEAWTGPSRPAPLATTPVRLPPPESSMRTVIVGRVWLPEAYYRTAEGNKQSLDVRSGEKLLVSLWSTTCAPCVAELTEWTRNEKALRAAGLNVLALCVDGMSKAPGEAGGDGDSRARQLLSRLRFPFFFGRALPELVDQLELVHRVYLELQQPLPVPCSFLLDAQGRLGVIYKGRVALDRLLEDAKLLDAGPEERRDSAVPFKGRWASNPFPASPEPIARALDLAGRTEEAKAYLERAAERAGGPDSGIAAVKRLGDSLLEKGELEKAAETYAELRRLAPLDSVLHREIGRQLLLKGRLEEASRHFELAVAQEPENAALLYNFGLAEMGLRRPEAAAKHFRRSLELRPDDVTTSFHLANALLAQGDAEGAIRYFRRSLEITPGWPYAANNLAWLLATHPDDGIRDGAEAVRLAEGVCRASNYQDHAALATLAAAYAEAGRYAEAVKTSQRAIEIAEAKAPGETVEQLRRRHELYVANRPFRDARK